MKEISKEIIEIGGQEYTLFLNRKGIIAFEKYCKDEQEVFVEGLNQLDKDINQEKVEIKDDTDPFEGLEEYENAHKTLDTARKIYIKLYWIMLYTNHQLSLKAVEDLYSKACEEYGEVQVRALADQMVEEVNTEPLQENLKNLKALKPKK